MLGKGVYLCFLFLPFFMKKCISNIWPYEKGIKIHSNKWYSMRHLREGTNTQFLLLSLENMKMKFKKWSELGREFLDFWLTCPSTLPPVGLGNPCDWESVVLYKILSHILNQIFWIIFKDFFQVFHCETCALWLWSTVRPRRIVSYIASGSFSGTV